LRFARSAFRIKQWTFFKRYQPRIRQLKKEIGYDFELRKAFQESGE
jgi:hypothetical protein